MNSSIRGTRPAIAATLRAAAPLFLLLTTLASTAVAQNEAFYRELRPGAIREGFRAESVYLDDAGRPMGGRFVHVRSGFTVDLLEIQSVPQAFLWVKSYPTSDMGEPHTQEHLLLGKGNKGLFVAGLENMSLGSSSAYTEQWRTIYHLNTAAGTGVFFSLFEASLDALLHPDYTDEEIRREVMNYGVVEDPATGALRIEEKGTVYNEMVSSFERSWSRMARALDHALYGKNHPLAYSSGGLPEAIRKMQPEHIRKFHRDNYHLRNMGMIATFPSELAPAAALRQFGAIFDRLQPDAELAGRPVVSEKDLPAPAPARAGSIFFAEYPHLNPDQASPMLLSWPADRALDPRQQELLGLFLQNIGGEPGTELYSTFVDSRSRSIDIGATGVYGWVSSDPGNPITIYFSDVTPSKVDSASVVRVRAAVMEQLQRIASLPDGSPELKAFNARVLNRIGAERRSMSKFISSPPGFGQRGTGSSWLQNLEWLARIDGFEKSLTFRPVLDWAEAQVRSDKNVWRDRLKEWGMLGRLPYVAVAVPSADLIRRESDERALRADAEITRLKGVYRTTETAETIRRYRDDYNRTTRQLDSITALIKSPSFIADPPMTLDDQLKYDVRTVAGSVPLVVSTFSNMTSASLGVALRMDGVPAAKLHYVSLLPTLMTGSGVIVNGAPVSSEEVNRRIREEILSLGASYSINYLTGRCELVVRGAGNSAAETERAAEWIATVLSAPDWRVENLPRLRDLVDQNLASLRNTMQGSEESWVRNPAMSYWKQGSPLLLATGSFLTREHNLLRLRWLLKDAGHTADRDVISEFLMTLAQAPTKLGRDDLKLLLGAIVGDSATLPSSVQSFYSPMTAGLSAGARALAADAARDLMQTIASVPDASLNLDWVYLCRLMHDDLMIAPAQALSDLNSVRQGLLRKGNARLFAVGSAETTKRLEDEIGKIVALLDNGGRSPAFPTAATGLVTARLKERGASQGTPVYVALVNPNTSSGVFLNSAPSAGYESSDPDALRRYLAALLYASGPHSIFMKTWAAGLAYSNGIGAYPNIGRVQYYAERVPELPQTLGFVIDEIKKAKPDPSLTEYAIAFSFGGSRADDSYDYRGEAMAADLADGQTPEMIRKFRERLLELRRDPKLTEQLFRLMPDVYDDVLPGFEPGGSAPRDAVYMVIGPEKQLELYESYLKRTESPDSRLIRIYPRDFWITPRTLEP